MSPTEDGQSRKGRNAGGGGELPYRVSGEALLLKVKVIPNAGRSEIAGVRGGELLLRLRAAPEKGEANRELLQLLARALSLPRAQVLLVRGQLSRHKVLRLPARAAKALSRHLEGSSHG
jgi:uncharacterized protein (TIGR00251 family)